MVAVFLHNDNVLYWGEFWWFLQIWSSTFKVMPKLLVGPKTLNFQTILARCYYRDSMDEVFGSICSAGSCFHFCPRGVQQAAMDLGISDSWWPNDYCTFFFRKVNFNFFFFQTNIVAFFILTDKPASWTGSLESEESLEKL